MVQLVRERVVREEREIRKERRKREERGQGRESERERDERAIDMDGIMCARTCASRACVSERWCVAMGGGGGNSVRERKRGWE